MVGRAVVDGLLGLTGIAVPYMVPLVLLLVALEEAGAEFEAVRVMLARLEKKGYLKHQVEGVRYLYSATISPAAAKRSALQQVVQTFFGGSVTKMMTALVSEESWTDDELAALKAEIDRVRKERRQS